MKKALFILILAAGVVSCRKDSSKPFTVQSGVVRALITVQHHGIPIPYARVFVKQGTLIFPGTDTTLYDLRLQADAEGQVIYTGIPDGQQAYTFYGKGVDPNWDSTHVTPVWGYQFLITDTQPLENKDYPVSLPVSE
ncbi:MAG TPA: hypothetical protein VFU15_00705 [Bacteroidia bacterium]|nr:hypothetical protein [Bacteroidia bacterium]